MFVSAAMLGAPSNSRRNLPPSANRANRFLQAEELHPIWQGLTKTCSFGANKSTTRFSDSTLRGGVGKGGLKFIH
jgi:hypothetical protein